MALLLTLSLGLVACGDDRPADTTATGTTTADPYATDRTYDDEAITSPSMLMDSPNAEAMDGRDVRFMNVRVVEVLGDSAMYIASTAGMGAGMDPGAQTDPTMAAGAGDRVLVMRDQGLWNTITGRDTIDDDIRSGLMVDVEGNVRVWDADDASDMPTSPLTVGSLYVEASSIDRHDPARMGGTGTTGTGTTTPGTHTPGATGGTTTPGATSPGTTDQGAMDNRGAAN